MTYTTFAILIYGFVLVMYSLGTWATNWAVDSVREMDKHDDAWARYQKFLRELEERTRR